MIPTEEQAKELWNTYHLPEKKRLHVSLVTRVAVFLAQECQRKIPESNINISLLRASALLHDIDKAAERLQGEQHPDTAVRLLRKNGMDEVADIVRSHPLHAILDPTIAPTIWEEKLLYLSDKMVKFEILTVDKRFQLWRVEELPPEARNILEQSYPKVKALEREIFDSLGITVDDVAKRA